MCYHHHRRLILIFLYDLYGSGRVTVIMIHELWHVSYVSLLNHVFFVVVLANVSNIFLSLKKNGKKLSF